MQRLKGCSPKGSLWSWDLSERLAGRADGNRKRHYAIALGSLGEVSAALDIAIALGLVREDSVLEALIGRLGAMLGALIR